MTAPDAMPERVWVVTSSSVGDGVVTAWDAWAEGLLKLFAFDDHCPDSIAYVKESRLLAAEARVREVEAERDAIADNCARASSGWIAATADFERLRAERDALVPLAWLGIVALDDDDGRFPSGDAIRLGVLNGRFEETSVVARARALLRREEEA